MLKDSNHQAFNLPFYAKASLTLIGLFVLINMLSIGRSIIVPLLFASIFSILLSTVVDFLVQKKMDRLFAIILTVCVAVLIGALLTAWISTKANLLIDAYPLLMEKLDKLQAQFIPWFADHFNLDARTANKWVNDARTDLTHLSGSSIGDTLVSVGGIVGILLLLPVYIFLFLYYQPILIEFVHRAVGRQHENELSIVLSQTRSILKGYFAGLLIELVIVAILNSIGLLALGIQFAILLGIGGAVLNMIPYIGGAIQLVITMLMALLTKVDPMYAVYVAIVFFAIQVVDNNFIMPKIVGSKVKINALVAIVVVIAGGALWGVAGMFLAIPMIALIKVVFDRIEELQPWGFLLGDTMPPMVRIKLPGKRKVNVE